MRFDIDRLFQRLFDRMQYLIEKLEVHVFMQGMTEIHRSQLLFMAHRKKLFY